MSILFPKGVLKATTSTLSSTLLASLPKHVSASSITTTTTQNTTSTLPTAHVIGSTHTATQIATTQTTTTAAAAAAAASTVASCHPLTYPAQHQQHHHHQSASTLLQKTQPVTLSFAHHAAGTSQTTTAATAITPHDATITNSTLFSAHPLHLSTLTACQTNHAVTPFSLLSVRSFSTISHPSYISTTPSPSLASSSPSPSPSPSPSASPSSSTARTSTALSETLHELSSAATCSSWHPHLGVFGSALKTPADWLALAIKCRDRCDQLVHMIETQPPSLQTVKLNDEISNEVCSLLDVAEFCRNVHPSESWRDAATEIMAIFEPRVHHLNHHQGIYDKLKRLVESPEFSAFNPEEQRVTLLLKRDMDRLGVGFKEQDKQEISQLLSLQTQYCQALLGNITSHHSERFECHLAPSSFEGLPADFFGRILFSGRSVSQHGSRSDVVQACSIPADLTDVILRFVHNAETRKQVWSKAHQSKAESSVQYLDQLRAVRKAIATKLGYKSYSHYITSSLVGKSPENIVPFLQTALKDAKENGLAELRLIKEAKLKDLQVEFARSSTAGNKSSTFSLFKSNNPNPAMTTPPSRVDDVVVHPWDVAYYQGRLKAELFNLDASTISSYFPLPAVLEGLSLLAKKLFGVELRLSKPTKEENWVDSKDGVDDILKWDVYDYTYAPNISQYPYHIGTIYLDLYGRVNKFHNAANFTLRCGRAKDSTYSEDITTRQRSVVAIVMSLARPHTKRSVTLMGHNDVEVLLHEFGHSMHHILSRTQFQHMSGARGEVDFVESHSTLLQSFAFKYDFVKLWAKHHEFTSAVVPEHMIEGLYKARQLFKHADIFQVASQALMDQLLFGENTDIPAQAIFDSIQREYALVPAVGASTYLRSSHLCYYGASYYSYLYCRIFASALWERYLSKSPLNSTEGETLRRDLFQPGSAIEPEAILRKSLNIPPTVSLHEWIRSNTQYLGDS